MESLKSLKVGRVEILNRKDVTRVVLLEEIMEMCLLKGIIMAEMVL